MTSLEDMGADLIREMEQKNAAREQALAASRELTRSCALSIRAVHRGENDKARELLDKAKAISDQMISNLKDQPEFRYAGYVQDSQKELAEAFITYALINREPIPSRQQLGVEPAPYMNGMGETVGELRRFILDKLRQGEMDRCEEILQVMDDIYSILVTIDFPDAMTGGLRRTTDLVRGIMEKTRGDLTTALRQRDLQLALEKQSAASGQPSTSGLEEPELTFEDSGLKTQGSGLAE
ncbi:MAG: haloacid dehalogenase [Chloroflexota bacterium]|jgi:translin